MKLRTAVMFGGKSVEHEVSVISGIQALMALDTDKYEPVPVYISKDNMMYVGEGIGKIESYKDIRSLLRSSTRVIIVNTHEGASLVSYPSRLFGGKYDQPIDVVLPVVHGTNEEDGTLQGFLKTLGLPFAGCDVTGSAVGMDKYLQKQILKAAGVPVLEAEQYMSADYASLDRTVERIEERFGYPVICKPVNLGSSVGIGIAHDRRELKSRLDDAFNYATRVLVERAVEGLREINCSVLGDDDSAEASVCEEPLHSEEILSYSDKYMSGGSKKVPSSGPAKSGMASVSRRIPADIDTELSERIRSLSIKAFRALCCSGVARMDFILDSKSGELFFNEINTIPGSLAFYLWEASGVSFTALLDRVIELAMKRKRIQEALTFTFDSNILNNASFGGSKGKIS